MTAAARVAAVETEEAAALLAEIEALRAEKARRARARVESLWFEKACRVHSEGAFAAFVKLAWGVVETRDLEWAPYLDVLCDALHRQMRGDPEHQRLVINIPPGFAKSLLVSVFGPAFEWLIDPGRRKLFFSGDDSLSRRDSRKTRILLKSDIYQRVLAEVSRREGVEPWTFAADQNEKDNYENSRRGFRQCLTLRSGVTGKRGDDFVIDDPIDVKDVILGDYNTVLRRCREANNIINQALQTRVNDLRDARQTMIMQRLHPEDPAGAAIKSGRWKVICLPLHYDPDHPLACEDDPRTERGELLHPTRYRESDIAALREALGESQAEAQLEQRPTAASGERIKREWFRERYTCLPEDIARQADEVWLTSDTGKKKSADSDFHDIQCWAWIKGEQDQAAQGERRRSSKRYPLDRRAERMDYPEYESMMDGMIAKWAPFLREKGGVLIEDTANGATYLQVRGSEYMGVPLIKFDPTRDTPGKDKSKGARAKYLERAAESGGIVLPDPTVAPWVEDMLGWWLAFPKGAHDDAVDTASQLMMRWTIEESPDAGGWSSFDLYTSF